MPDWFERMPFPLRVCLGILGSLVTANADKLWGALGPIGDAAAVVLAAWVILGASWHFMNEWREKHEKPRLSFEPNYLLIMCLVGALIAALWQQFRPAVTTAAVPPVASEAKKEPLKTDFVIKHNVAVSYNGQGSDGSSQPMIVFGGEAAKSGPRLRFFLEFINADDPSPRFGSNRILIKEIKDFYKGQPLNVTIATRAIVTNGHVAFRWGENTQDAFAGAFFARLIISNDNDVEQKIYFLITEGMINNQRFVTVLNQHKLNFVSLWEAYDAKN